MNIFVDVDYTLIAANGSPRPHARELFIRLKEFGHSIYVWSGMGRRESEMEAHGLAPFVDGYSVKPLEDYVDSVAKMKLGASPDLVVDDHADIVEAFGGYAVKPYFFPEDRDRDLSHAASAILDYAESGTCTAIGFKYPPGSIPETTRSFSLDAHS